MVHCPKCRSGQWNSLFRCPVDPANDKFQCRACGHKFLRYDPPTVPPIKLPEPPKDKLRQGG